MRAVVYLYAHNAAVCAIALLSVVNVALTITGVVKGYSIVPYWDMWNGYLGFFAALSEGDWSAWWAPHNEHRIVLSRLLFWLDFNLFEGLGVFLLFTHFALLGLVFLTLLACLRQQSFAVAERPALIVMSALLVSWMFSWSQHENLVWAFQSQFLLAQLVPLLALFCHARSVQRGEKGLLYFCLAVVFGVLSAGTMANGVLVLPLMVIYSVLTRSGTKRHVLLVMLSLVTIWAYFAGNSPAGSSLLQGLMSHPLDVIHYVLLYLGGPIFYLSPTSVALELALISATLLIITAVVLARLELSSKVINPTRLALLTFLLYVGGTAVATASGRVSLGVELALSSRYMTPALAAWAALGVLLAPSLLKLYRRFQPCYLAVGIGLASLMTATQLNALNTDDNELYQRRLAFLAVELGIDDAEQLTKIFPTSDYVLYFSNEYGDKGWSAFGAEPFRGARNKMGSGEREPLPHQCDGALTQVLQVENDLQYQRLRGWIAGAESAKTGWISVRNQQLELVGIGLLEPSNSGNSALPHRRRFTGYMLTRSLGEPLRVESRDAACGFQAHAPDPWLQFDVPSLPEAFIVKLSDEGTGWGELPAIAVKSEPQPLKERD